MYIGLLVQRGAAVQECRAPGYGRQVLPAFELGASPPGFVEPITFKTLAPIRFPPIDGAEWMCGYMLFDDETGGEPRWVTTLPELILYTGSIALVIQAGALMYHFMRAAS